jgi:DNA-binding beta-propeller fold protein YncE
MVVAPQRGEVYVLDGATETVAVIDVNTHKLVHRFPKENAPRAIAITPDESKLYVANEQPAPQGSISVIDLASRQLKESITGVNCPEGLAMSADGKQLYVSTQCGGGTDPVFVIDTKTDIVRKAAIPGLAVGGAIAITPNGEKLYVARGRFVVRDSSTGKLSSFPDQISVVDTKSRQVTVSLPMNGLLFAMTPDGKYILAVDGPRLNFIDTKSDTVVKTIQFETTPGGVAVGRSDKKGSLLFYVWLPEENRLFFSGLSGVLPISTN